MLVWRGTVSEDSNQNLKEKEVTLNLTEEELEEYKTYLKFKNKFEEQEESQNTIEDMTESVEEVITEDIDDPEYTFTKEDLEMIGYKQYFGKCIDESIAEPHEQISIFMFIQMIAGAYVFYYTVRKMDGVFWSIVEITITIGIVVFIWCYFSLKNNAKKRCLLYPKIERYNSVVKDASWIRVSNNDERFDKYNSIAQDILKNKVRVDFTNIEFRRDKYTEVYQISNSNFFVVFGICEGISKQLYVCAAYMVVMENEDYLLNVVGKQIGDTK